MSGDDPSGLLVLANPAAGSSDDELLGTVCRTLGTRTALEVAVTGSEDDVQPVTAGWS